MNGNTNGFPVAIYGDNGIITGTVSLSSNPRPTHIRILLINPNATPSMTSNCLKMVAPTLPTDVTVTGLTAPHPSPTAIEGAVDNVLSSAASFRAVLPIQHDQEFDAMLVACYSDHALIRMLREEFYCPVIGIMEASLFAARTLGARFGIVATGPRSKIIHGDAVRHYGMEGFCAGIESCDLGVLELERRAREEVLKNMQRVARKLVGMGAEVLTLGCAGMTDMRDAVEDAVKPDVQVVDGVVAGVHHLIGLVRMSGRTAKGGMYASSKAGRERRGQTYV